MKTGARWWAGCLAVALGCGAAPPVVVEPSGALLPVALGNRWTFQVTSSSGVVFTKTQTVTGTTSVDGQLAYRLTTVRNDSNETRSIQVERDGRLLRVSEETLERGVIRSRFRFSPYGLRIDSRLVNSGDRYTFTGEKIEVDAAGTDLRVVDVNDFTFTVEEDRELVTVPAGTLECVRVRREEAGGRTKIYWYAKGVGKVKEVGGQTEELARAEVAID